MVNTKGGRITYVLCVLFVLFWNCCVCTGKTFKIAFLAPGPSSTYPINTDNSVDGLNLALRSITKNPNILNGHKIAVKFFDTKCNAQSAVTTAMMVKTTFNPDVIVGPPCHEALKMVAQLGTYWNLPVLSWYHTGNEFNSAKTYPTLVRMTPPLHLLSKTLVHVLTQNKWGHVSVLYIGREPWSLLEDPVREDAAAAGVEIHGVYKVTSNISTTALKYMYQHIQRVANAVIMICPFDDVRRFLLTAASVGMTNGTYAFIHLDPEIYTDTDLRTKVLSNGGWKRGDVLDIQARKAYESVFHVVVDPTTEKADRQVLNPRSKFSEYSKMAVYESRFTQPSWNIPSGVMPDVYSAYLCDAVVVWSVLVNMLDIQRKDYRDGKLLASFMRRMTADGTTGNIELSENLDRLGEVYILDMQPDGNFKPIQFLKFNKTDGYSVRYMDRINHLMSESTRRKTVVGQVSSTHQSEPVTHVQGTTPSTTAKTTISTTTTASTTTKTTTSTTPSTTTPLPTSTTPSSTILSTTPTSTTSTDPPTATTTTTTTQASTTPMKYESNIMERLKAIEAAMKLTQQQRTKKPYMETSTIPPSNFVTSSSNRNVTIDPYLGNFDVRLKKKRKVYAKAQKILDTIRETGDPNVAAFLRLALDRLNTEEELVSQRQQRMLARKRKMNKVNLQNQQSVHVAQQYPTIPPVPITESTLPTPYPTQTTIPPTTVLITKPVATTTLIPTTVPILGETTTPEVTTRPPTTKGKTKRTTTTEIPTTIPTTHFYYDETTTQAATKRPRHNKNNGKTKGKMPKRRLRQKWLNEVTAATTTAVTTQFPPNAEVDIIMADNKMISSIVDQVANKLMGKVTGEIQTLKQSIKSMQSTIAKNTSKNASGPKATVASNGQMSLPNIKADINRSLIKEISANVLTKLSGVSWLEQKPEVPQVSLAFQQPHLAATIAQPIGRTQHVYQAPLIQSTLPPTTRPTQPTTVRAPTRKPAPPKILGSWMSGLPPAISMQLFAVETVAPKGNQQLNTPLSRLSGSSQSRQQSNMKASRGVSTRNNPFNLRNNPPVHEPINANKSVIKAFELPVRHADLFKGSITNGMLPNQNNAIPLQSQSNERHIQSAVVKAPSQPLQQVAAYQKQNQPVQHETRNQPVQQAVAYQTPNQPVQQAVAYQATNQPVQHTAALQTPNQPVQQVAGYQKAKHQPAQQPDPYQTPNQPVQQASQYQTPNQPVQQASQYQTANQQVQQAVAPYQTPNQPVQQAVQYQTTNQQVQQAAQYQTPNQPVQQAAKYQTANQQVQQAAQFQTPNQQVQQAAQYQTPNQPVQQAAQYQTPNQQVQQAAQYQTPNQPVQQAVQYQTANQQVQQAAPYQSPNQPVQHAVPYQIPNQPGQSADQYQTPTHPVQQPVLHQTPNQPGQPAPISMDSIIANITNSVLAGVNKQIDSLKTSMTGQSHVAPQPRQQPQPPPATPKPVLSLRQTFHKTVSAPSNNKPGNTRLTGHTPSDIVNQISDAVIKQLSSGNVNTHVAQATNPPPTTDKPQEHEPEPQHTNGNGNNNGGGGGGGSASMADNIASKVFGKMNAKLDSLSNAVDTLQRNIGQQELEEIPPEMFGGRGNQMGGNRGMMQMPNMPPMGMMPMPFPPQSLREAFGQGTPNSQTPNMDIKPVEQPPSKELTQMKFNMPSENSASWMSPTMNPWINGGRQNQGGMWGSPSNSWWA